MRVAAVAAVLFVWACGGGQDQSSSSDAQSSVQRELAKVPAAAAKSPEEMVNICHIPPGNPANAHEITVGERAARAHIVKASPARRAPIAARTRRRSPAGWTHRALRADLAAESASGPCQRQRALVRDQAGRRPHCRDLRAMEALVPALSVPTGITTTSGTRTTFASRAYRSRSSSPPRTCLRRPRRPARNGSNRARAA